MTPGEGGHEGWNASDGSQEDRRAGGGVVIVHEAVCVARADSRFGTRERLDSGYDDAWSVSLALVEQEASVMADVCATCGFRGEGDGNWTSAQHSGLCGGKVADRLSPKCPSMHAKGTAPGRGCALAVDVGGDAEMSFLGARGKVESVKCAWCLVCAP